MTEQRVPNYKLLKYEIDNLDRSLPNVLYNLYKGVAFRYRLCDLYDWFMTFSYDELLGICILNSPSFGHNKITNDRLFSYFNTTEHPRAVVYAETINGVRGYFSSWNL